MSQSWTDDVYDSTHVGATDLGNIEDNFACIKSSWSGSSAPSNPVAGMLWLDTTNHILKIRNEANTAWLSIFNMSTGKAIDADAVSGITITAGTGLSGGGALSTNRTINHSAHTGDVTGAAALALASGIIVPGDLINYVAGTQLEGRPLYNLTNVTSYAEMGKNYAIRSGTIRFYMQLKAGGAATVYGRIYKNGSPFGTERSTTSTSGQSWSEDLSVSASDKMSLYLKTGSGSVYCYGWLNMGIGNAMMAYEQLANEYL